MTAPYFPTAPFIPAPPRDGDILRYEVDPQYNRESATFSTEVQSGDFLEDDGAGGVKLWDGTGEIVGVAFAHVMAGYLGNYIARGPSVVKFERLRFFVATAGTAPENAAATAAARTAAFAGLKALGIVVR